ncbi:MAG: ACT domain-containing protein, partial [Gammaproteobacteria bacterium]
QLHRWLGEGEVSVTQFVQAATRLAAPRNATPPAVPVRRRTGGSRKKRAGGGPVMIEGVGDLPITLARCCAPIRPEAVAGYVTLGRGVTVHAARCASLARMRASHPDRVLRVDWRDDDGDGMPVGLRIEAWDRRGLVRDISEIVAGAGLGIESLTTTTDRAAGTATTVLRTAVRDLGQLSQVLRALARVPNVISARRAD